MSCASNEIDLKAYVLGEAPQEERRAVELHLKSCPTCQEEAARLGFLQSSLLALRDEEVPRRIAFVSDKVFEPSWLQRFWQSGARLGFASAALVAASIVTHAVYRPAPAVLPQAPVAGRAQPVNVQAVVDAAVKQAIAESDARHEKRTAQLQAASEKRIEQLQLQNTATQDAKFEYLLKKVNGYTKQVASVDFGGAR